MDDLSESNLQTPRSNLLKAQGVVEKISDTKVWIKPIVSGGCSSCHQGSCGNKALSDWLKPQQKPVELPKPRFELKHGDVVTLVMDESRLVKHSLLAYGLPLFLMFVMALVLSMLSSKWLQLDSEVLTILGAFLGLGLGFVLTRYVYKPYLPSIEK